MIHLAPECDFHLGYLTVVDNAKLTFSLTGASTFGTILTFSAAAPTIHCPLVRGCPTLRELFFSGTLRGDGMLIEGDLASGSPFADCFFGATFFSNKLRMEGRGVIRGGATVRRRLPLGMCRVQDLKLSGFAPTRAGWTERLQLTRIFRSPFRGRGSAGRGCDDEPCPSWFPVGDPAPAEACPTPDTCCYRHILAYRLPQALDLRNHDCFVLSADCE
ncbi:hypothetical protein quinque_011235 [Culex quinquefasciatus]